MTHPRSEPHRRRPSLGLRRRACRWPALRRAAGHRRHRPRPDRPARGAAAVGAAPAELRRWSPSCCPAGRRGWSTSAPGPACRASSLALARPDLPVDLVEPMQRRCEFLTETVAELGLADRYGSCEAGPRTRGSRRGRRRAVGDRPRGGAAGPTGEMVPAVAASGRAAAGHEGRSAPRRGGRASRGRAGAASVAGSVEDVVRRAAPGCCDRAAHRRGGRRGRRSMRDGPTDGRAHVHVNDRSVECFT